MNKIINFLIISVLFCVSLPATGCNEDLCCEGGGCFPSEAREDLKLIYDSNHASWLPVENAATYRLEVLNLETLETLVFQVPETTVSFENSLPAGFYTFSLEVFNELEEPILDDILIVEL